MKLKMGTLSTLVWVIVLSPVGFSQRLEPNQPGSPSTGAKASLAIAWSEMQTPQPVPSVTQAFTGTVVKMADKYVLITMDNTTYQLDDQDEAKEFEGKQVQIRGDLDPAGKLINIRGIEAVPEDH